MAIEVVIPWLGGCEHREAAREWLLLGVRHELKLPYRIAERGLPWSKGAAIVKALEASSAEIVVIHDADVWSDGTAEAISRVSDGAAWAMPHGRVHRLTEAGTAAVLDGDDWREQPLEQGPYIGLYGGGIVVARRDVLLDAPPDPRFIGWGHEDEAWDIALHTLYGRPWRGDADLVHLWHPAQPRRDRRFGSQPNWDLRRRYLKARRSPEMIRELIAEAT